MSKDRKSLGPTEFLYRQGRENICIIEWYRQHAGMACKCDVVNAEDCYKAVLYVRCQCPCHHPYKKDEYDFTLRIQ